MRQNFVAFVVINMSNQAQDIRQSTSHADQAPVDRSRPISPKIVRNVFAIVMKFIPPPSKYHGFCQSRDLVYTTRVFQYQYMMEFHRSLCTLASKRLDSAFWWNYMNVPNMDDGTRRLKYGYVRCGPFHRTTSEMSDQSDPDFQGMFPNGQRSRHGSS